MKATTMKTPRRSAMMAQALQLRVKMMYRATACSRLEHHCCGLRFAAG
jgi:hypothetical protein